MGGASTLCEEIVPAATTGAGPSETQFGPVSKSKGCVRAVQAQSSKKKKLTGRVGTQQRASHFKLTLLSRRRSRRAPIDSASSHRVASTRITRLGVSASIVNAPSFRLRHSKSPTHRLHRTRQ